MWWAPHAGVELVLYDSGLGLRRRFILGRNHAGQLCGEQLYNGQFFNRRDRACIVHHRSASTSRTRGIGSIQQYNKPDLECRCSSGQLLDQLLQRLWQHHQRLHSVFEQPARFRINRYELREQRAHRFFHLLLCRESS